MTHEEMRETDAKVAAVLGWRNIRDADGYDHWTGDPPADWHDFHGNHCEDELPYFSGDPGAAVRVLEAFCSARGWAWQAEGLPGCPVLVQIRMTESVAIGSGDTFALAVCRAVFAVSEVNT